MGVTLSLHLHKGICYVSCPEQVAAASLALFGMQQEDSICAQNRCVPHRSSCDNSSRYSVYFVYDDSFFFGNIPFFKLLALMSARRKGNCEGTLVEIILGYQSKIPSKQQNFTPTFDSCDTGFARAWPAVSVSLSLAAGAPSFPLSLSLSLSLHVTLSLSIFSICPPLSVNGNSSSAPTSSPCLYSPTPLLGTVLYFFLYLLKTLQGVLRFWRFQVLSFNEV